MVPPILDNPVAQLVDFIATTPTQPQLNSKVGSTTHHHQPGSQCQQYLSCYRPDFDQTLNAGSWEHLEEIPSVTGTFVQATITSNLTEIGTAQPKLVMNYF